jgi:hypothetical protein
MENFYEELYQYLIERGIDDDEATEVVNYLYEDNIHEYGLLTENKGRHFLNMLRAVGYMSGVLKKPGARQAVKQVIPKVQQGTPLQGNLLTKKGTAQNFTGGRMPFTGTSPVPAASSPLPQPAAPAPQAPGQMRIPGLSSRAQELRNVTGNPNLGLPGNTQGFAVAGGNIANRSKSILRAQPQRTAPGLPQPPASPAAPKNNLAKVAIPVGVAGATGLALSGGQPPKKGEDPRRPDGSLPPYTPPRPAAAPAPAPAPKAETPKEEPVRRPASKLTSAAKDFDRAFAAARKEGKKEFTWRGKQYNTKYKGE